MPEDNEAAPSIAQAEKNRSERSKLIIFHPSNFKAISEKIGSEAEDALLYSYDDLRDDTKANNLLTLLRQECLYREDELSEHGHNGIVKKIFIGGNSHGVTKVFLDSGKDKSFTVYSGKDEENYMFNSIVENDGTLSITAQLLAADGHKNLVRSPDMPHLRDLIGLALGYYASSGVKITGIRGVWGKYLGGGKNKVTNSNFAAFKNSLANGMTQEEAAFTTPTGKSVKSFGYDTVEVEENTLTSAAIIFRKSNP